jgi:hypothetical protein
MYINNVYFGQYLKETFVSQDIPICINATLELLKLMQQQLFLTKIEIAWTSDLASLSYVCIEVTREARSVSR